MVDTNSPGAGKLICRQLFGIDYRSLAAFRIGLGVLILFDLWNRSSAIEFHYSDNGIVPRSLCNWGWSFHALSGAWQFQAGLFLIAAFAAVALLIGVQTRLATVVTWLLCVSLQNRNILISNSGDMLLALLLFWAMFLPLESRWSVDQIRKHNPRATPGRHCSAATIAILLQLCLMYLFSGIFKLNAVWLDGTAMQNALNQDLLARPLAYEMLQHPRVLEVVSRITPWLELALPVLCFVPWFTGVIRCVVIVIAAIFHISIELTLATGLFPYVCMLGWLLFLPGGFWNRIGSFNSRSRANSRASDLSRQEEFDRKDHGLEFPKTATELLPVIPPVALSLHSPNCCAERSALPPEKHSSETFRTLLIFSLLGYTVIYNIDEWLWKEKGMRIMPQPLQGIGGVTRLAQKWDMFEKPQPQHGWFVVTGTVGDGRKVDLLSGTFDPSRARYLKPFPVADQFPNDRWRKFYMALLMSETSPKYIRSLARSLGQIWNSAHDPMDKVQEVEIEFLNEAEKSGKPHRVLERSLHHVEDCRTQG